MAQDSKILSYSTLNTATTDWAPTKAYTDEEIKLIRDPNGGQAEYPRTAIPSPFARLELTKTAFIHVATNPNSANLDHVSAMDRRLVSDALDIAQLFFNYENYKELLHVVRWNRAERIANMLTEPGHQLYAQTLDLFFTSDASSNNFNGFNDWYILMCADKVLGATSPTSFVMSAPVQGQFNNIMVEQGRPLFADGITTQLWERKDEDFIDYMFMYFNAYADKLLTPYDKVIYAYLRKTMAVLQQQNPALAQRINSKYQFNNALAFSIANAQEVLDNKLSQQYSAFEGEDDVNVFGARFYCKRRQDIMAQVQMSDFLIEPGIKQEPGEKLPLVLQNRFDDSADKYKYVDRNWNSATVVLAEGKPLAERVLPDTQIRYPFITADDVLQPTLMRLGGEIDAQHFFNGNLRGAAESGYLLPLKPLLFKYFTSTDLMGTVNGQKCVELIQNSQDRSVRVVVRIPVQKRFVELSRLYRERDNTWEYSETDDRGQYNGEGNIIDVQLSTAIFPFVRTNTTDNYSVQLFSMSGQSNLSFFRNGNKPLAKEPTFNRRTSVGNTTTSYYDVLDTFDYTKVDVDIDRRHLEGYILPQWKQYVQGGNELVFAVDFGTTNSHVEWAPVGAPPQPFTFDYSHDNTLVASLVSRGKVANIDQFQDVEFLPHAINSLYGFPLRTALLSNRVSENRSTKLFDNMNIPFLYERKAMGGQYNVTTNIKWLGDSSLLATEFLREIVMLIKAKAMLEGADLDKVRIVYFYPVSMSSHDRSNLMDKWEQLYRTYISANEESMKQNLIVYPESIAPAYYYKRANVAASSYVTVDIGGGTCDTVIYQPEGNDSRPKAISSFRFAGNTMFGDAFTEKDAENNPLIEHYVEYFKKTCALMDSTRALNDILDSIMKDGRSEDINAFLFSIENVEQVRSMKPIDRSHYSYNDLLRRDKYSKVTFMYFYAAIIYYIASSMKARNYVMPKRIFFSGTGSKILNILGRTELVSRFTKLILEGVFGNTYAALGESFDIQIESESPKQITCRGGIKLACESIDEKVDNADFAPERMRGLKYRYSMVGDDEITFDQLSSPDTPTCKALLQEVHKFNRFFIDNLCTADVREDFGVEKDVFNIFQEHVEDDISSYLTEGIRVFLKTYRDKEVIEDIPFFYPLIGSIRYNLLRYLQYKG